jgi:hypothetical protein
VSSTVTVKLQLSPGVEQLTVVVPLGKDEPEAGLHAGVPQAGGVVKPNVTTALHWFGPVLAVILAGQVSAHDSTVTLNVHIASGLKGLSSEAVQVTVVMPTGKQNPEGGVQLTVASPQALVAVGGV